MKKFYLLACLAMGLLLFSNCVDPEENEANPDLKVVNDFNDYKISEVFVNNQTFKQKDEYLLPGDSTDYLKVSASQSLLLAYKWENINNAADTGRFSRATAIGEYPELKENESYTLTYSGDKSSPTISITQP